MMNAGEVGEFIVSSSLSLTGATDILLSSLVLVPTPSPFIPSQSELVPINPPLTLIPSSPPSSPTSSSHSSSSSSPSSSPEKNLPSRVWSILRKKKQKMYIVKQFVGKRTRNGLVQYKVRWEGYNPCDDTWESERSLEKDLIDFDVFVESFQQRRRQKQTNERKRKRKLYQEEQMRVAAKLAKKARKQLERGRENEAIK